MSNSRRVSYFYDVEVGNYHYGQGKTGTIGVTFSASLTTVYALIRTLPFVLNCGLNASFPVSLELFLMLVQATQ